MVSLTALVAGAAIAGGATILSRPSGNSPQVPLVMGYDGANNARQAGPPPPSESATALAAGPGSSAPGSSAPATSSSAPSSSAPPSAGSSGPSSPTSPVPPPATQDPAPT